MKIDFGSMAKGIQETVSNAANEVHKVASEAGAGMATQVQQGTEHLKQAGQKVAEDRKGSMNLNAGVLSRELHGQVGKSVSVPFGEIGAKGKFQAGIDGKSLGEKFILEGEAAIRAGVEGTAGPAKGKAGVFGGVKGNVHEQVQLKQPLFDVGAEAFLGVKAILGGELEGAAGGIGGQVEGWAGFGADASVHVKTDEEQVSVGGRAGAGLFVGGAAEGNVTVNTKIDSDK